jgi:hypothetical protein
VGAGRRRQGTVSHHIFDAFAPEDALQSVMAFFDRHPALGFSWSMMFSENRYPLFGIML